MLLSSIASMRALVQLHGDTVWEKNPSSRTFLHVLLITLRPAKLHVSLAPWPMTTKAQVR